MNGAVFDTSAVLAIINSELGAEQAIAMLDGALLCTVNHAEVMTKLAEHGLSREQARAIVLKIGIVVVDFGIDLADRTGTLRMPTRHLGLSLADRACLALAEREAVPAVTADRQWAATDLGIEVVLIR
jgi:PIN domain nuclease of toxin-antitoxin system